MKRFTALLFLAASISIPIDRSAHASGLFDSRAPLALELDAPLSRLFADPSSTAKVEGTLRYTDPVSKREVVIRGVSVAVRGHSSRHRDECTFPKLELRLPRGVPLALFAGMHAVAIGTHCGERPDGDLTKLGRLANEKSPLREAFVYGLLEAAGVPTLRARAARITYINGATRLVRGAMLLETDRDAIVRLGGAGQLKGFTTARNDFSAPDSAARVFAESMIGNFDWSVKFYEGDDYRTDRTHPLWNVIAVRRADGSAFPLMHDFDLAGMVAGAHPWFGRVYVDRFLPSRSHPAVEALGQVERARTLFDRPVLDRVRQRFLAAKAAVYHAVDEAPIDEEGRTIAREYLDGFYGAIGDDDAFYRPAVIRAGTRPYTTSAGDADACGTDDRIPIGTVVGPPLDRRRGRMEVLLLDVRWHWVSRCDAVRRGPVWVDASAVGREYAPDAPRRTAAVRPERRSPTRSPCRP